MATFPWNLLGRSAPVKNGDNRTQSIKAFQQLWVAGTLGAFFTGLARNLPIHLAQTTAAFDSKYTVDVFARYFYLLWFLGYFFMSALGNDRPTASRTSRDIAFDVIQSVSSLTAAYFLGFIIPVKDYGQGAYIAANIAVFIICVVSLLLFCSSSRAGINRLRGFGAVVSVAGLALAIWWPLHLLVLITFALIGLLLWFLLALYIRIGVDE